MSKEIPQAGQCEDLLEMVSVPREEIDRLREALKFYADKEHFHFEDSDSWDSVSGEPSNFLWHESEPWVIEDGWIARTALEACSQPVPAAVAGEQKCDTCHGQGEVWTGRTNYFGQWQPPEPEMTSCPECSGQGRLNCSSPEMSIAIPELTVERLTRAISSIVAIEYMSPESVAKHVMAYLGAVSVPGAEGKS